MNKLVLATLALTALAVSTILMYKPAQQNTLVKSPALAQSIETILVQSPLNSVEQDRLDQLSRRYPQSTNAFQKLYALSKVEPQLAEQLYQQMMQKFVSQLGENLPQTKKLLATVRSAKEKDPEARSLKSIAQIAATRLNIE